MPFAVPSPIELAGLAALFALLVSFRLWLRWRPWAALARAYPHPGPFPDATITALGAEINGLVPRSGVVLGADDRGLHLASGSGRHRALVPWPAIRADLWTGRPPAEEQLGGQGGAARALARSMHARHAGSGLPASLMFGPEGDQWLYLPRPAAHELGELAAGVWPGGRKLRDSAAEPPPAVEGR